MKKLVPVLLVAYAMCSVPGYPCSVRPEPEPAASVFDSDSRLGVITVGPYPVFIFYGSGSPPSMEVGLRKRDGASTFSEVEARLTRAFSFGTTKYGQEVVGYVPESPLPDGEYFGWADRTIIVAQEAEEMPSPLGLIQGASFHRVEPSDPETSGGCSRTTSSCGPQQASSSISIVLKGITTNEAPYVGNYIVTIRNEGTGYSEVRLMGDRYWSPNEDAVVLWEERGAIDDTHLADRLCITIAGLGWSGHPGAAVDLGCYSAEES
jgi:hypothetical protein